jgi:hypothetical protein
LYDFGAENDNELSVTATELVEVISKLNENWWVVKKGNLSGLVPCNFLDENINGGRSHQKTDIRNKQEYEDIFADNNSYEPNDYDESDFSNLQRATSMEKTSSIPGKMLSVLEIAHARGDSQEYLPQAEMPLPENMRPEDRKRFEAIREMLNTESKYYEDLKIIIEVKYFF